MSFEHLHLNRSQYGTAQVPDLRSLAAFSPCIKAASHADTPGAAHRKPMPPVHT